MPAHMFWRDDSLQHAHHQQHQHIYLLPQPPVSPSAMLSTLSKSTDDVLIYAPVPLSSMTPQQARDLRASATEAWISPVGPSSTSRSSSSCCSSSLSSSSQSVRSHRHGHRYHHHHCSSGGGATGRISLPVSADEGLLPGYEESADLIDCKA